MGYSAPICDEWCLQIEKICLPLLPICKIDTMKKIYNELATIGLVVFFFLALLQPFGISQVGRHRLLLIVGESLSAVLTTAIAMFITIKVCGLNLFNTKGRLLCHAINTPLLSACLICYASWCQWGSISHEWYDAAGQFYVGNYLLACLDVAVISFFIFIFQIYRHRSLRLKQELDEVKAINKLLEERQAEETIDNGDSDLATCIIKGNAQNAVLEVNPAHILYIESMANYSNICYIKDGKLQHDALRITMKQLKDELAQYTFLVPCHRAFIVNLNFVASIFCRPSTGYSLQMFQTDKQIPVSRTYTKTIRERLKG